MACFIVSAAEAIIVTAVEKGIERKEKAEAKTSSESNVSAQVKIPLSRKLKWLTYMLWGGVILLAFEHIWHGEVVPWFPFLTAMADPADAAQLFTEMATVGVVMAALITVVWLIMCKVADVIVKRAADSDKQQEMA